MKFNLDIASYIKTNNKTGEFVYLDYTVDKTEDYLIGLKKKIRMLAVKCVLDEKLNLNDEIKKLNQYYLKCKQEAKEKQIKPITSSNSMTSQLSTSIQTMSVQVKKHIVNLDKVLKYDNIEDVEKIINDKIIEKGLDIGFYDKTIFDISEMTDFHQTNRRVMSLMIVISNRITMESRRGPANVIVFHPNSFFNNELSQLHENKNGFNYISTLKITLDVNIPIDEALICRCDQDSGNCIKVIYNLDESNKTLHYNLYSNVLDSMCVMNYKILKLIKKS